MRVGRLLPYEAGPRGRRPNRVHVTQVGLSQQRVLLDENLKTVPLEEGRNRLQVFPLIYLDDQLPNLGPISGRESPQDIQLALLDIDLQQVDPVDAFLGHDAGEGSQLGGYRSGTQAVIDQIADFRRQPLVVR